MPPFVGRAQELERAGELLAAGQGVLFCGPAGIGKTRLLQALEQQQDPPVERITATDATASIPLGALVRFLPTAVGDEVEPAALGATRAALRAIGERGAVIGIDDAERLDAVSAAVIADVARAGVPTALCSRTVEDLPPALLGLLDEEVIVLLPLDPLAEPDAVALVRAVAGKAVPTHALRWAVDLGEGNPLLLTELARVAPSAGPERFPLTERLRRAVGERLGGRSEPARHVVELLAYDAPLPLAAVREIAGAVALDELERHDIVAVGQGPAHLVRVTHPLITEVVGEQLTTARRSSLAAELIRTVGDGWAALPDGLVRHARWQIDAGQITDASILRDASRELLARWDPDAAAELAAVAREHLPDDPGPALVLAGTALVSGRYDEAERWYGTVDAASQVSPVQHLQATMGRAEAAFFGRGDAEISRRILERASSELPHAAEPIAALRAVIALCSGRYHQAIEAAEAVTSSAPVDARLVAAAVAHVAVGSSGRLDAAWRITEEALPLLDDPSVSPEHHFRFAAGRQYLRLHLGEIDEMRRHAHVTSPAEGLRAAASDFGLAYGEVIAGHGGRAADHLREASTRLERTDPYGHRTFVGAIAAELAALQGRRSAASRTARDAAASHRPHLGWWAWAVPAASGWAAAAAGRLTAACGHLREAAAVAAGNGDLVHRCCCLLGALRLGAADVATELAEASAAIDGRLWPAVAQAARGFGAATDDDLEQGCAALAETGAHLWAVALLASGARFDHAAGRSERAQRRLAAAERGARELVGIAPIALHSLRQGSRQELTSRQREVAILAAEGLTSREIADRLVVSVRTVDNHLGRVYAALDVASRRELAAALGLISHPTDGHGIGGRGG